LRTGEYVISVVLSIPGLIQNSNYCRMSCARKSNRKTAYHGKRSWLLQRNIHWNRILV